VTGTQMLFRM